MKKTNKREHLDHAKTNRNLRYHDNPHHSSNWCKICKLHYCFHKEVTGYANKEKAANHKFIPDPRRDIFDSPLPKDSEPDKILELIPWVGIVSVIVSIVVLFVSII